MTRWTDYQDDISDAISDSMDVDWSANDGARAVVAWLNEHRPLSAAPAPEGGAVKAACVVFQEDIDDFEAEAADVIAEGSERADLWDREITVNIDALKTVMSAALATREEAPAEAVEAINWKAEYEAVCAARISDRQKSQEIINERDKWIVELTRERDAIRAQPPAREDAQPVAIVPPHCTGTSLAFEPGVLHVSKDGSGYIAIDEKHFSLEDDRCEGPDGPEGSVHWITRLDASEVVALRDFLTGVPHPAPDALRRAVEALEQTRDRIQTWPIDDHDTCMCGSSVSSHSMGSGHSPVSQADHAVSTIVEELNKALAALQAEQGAK